MKNNVLVLALILCSSIFATGQEIKEKKDSVISVHSVANKYKNELSFNFLDYIMTNRRGFAYERFLNKKNSIELSGIAADKIGFAPKNNINENKSNSFTISYIRYFNKKNTNYGFFINPFIRTRFGNKFNYSGYNIDGPNNYEFHTVSPSKFGSGLGLGWKLLSNRVSFKIKLDLTKNFVGKTKTFQYTIENNNIPSYEFKLNCGLGYRF